MGAGPPRPRPIAAEIRRQLRHPELTYTRAKTVPTGRQTSIQTFTQETLKVEAYLVFPTQRHYDKGNPKRVEIHVRGRKSSYFRRKMDSADTTLLLNVHLPGRLGIRTYTLAWKETGRRDSTDTLDMVFRSTVQHVAATEPDLVLMEENPAERAERKKKRQQRRRIRKANENLGTLDDLL